MSCIEIANQTANFSLFAFVLWITTLLFIKKKKTEHVNLYKIYKQFFNRIHTYNYNYLNMILKFLELHHEKVYKFLQDIMIIRLFQHT